MKRISMSTAYTQSQSMIVSNQGKDNEVKNGMIGGRVKEKQEKDEKQSLNQIDCQLFGFNKLSTCFGSKKKDTQVNPVNYHKLRYRRVSQRQISNNKKQAQTQSIKQFFTDTKSIMPINLNAEHHNMSSLSFITFSPYEAKIGSSDHQTKPSFITTTTVSSLLRIPQTRYHNLQQKENHLSVRIINKKNPSPKSNSPRFSTLDSYRVKSNLQETVHSTSPHKLLVVSKLSESISFKEEDKSNEQIQQKNMRNKQFMRSLKDSHNMRETDSPIKYFKSVQYDNKNIKQSQISADSNERSLVVNSIKTIRPQNLPCVNRKKTLAQCANTIVSLYNKSSQKVQRLQQSNVVFQASKQVEEQGYKKNTISKSGTNHDAIIVSDGEIAMRKCSNKQKKVKNYQSFSEKYQNNSSDHIIQVELDQVSINKNNNKFQGNKFLRTQRKSFPLERTSYDNNVEFDEIKFDSNTFTEYGPL